MLQFSRRSVKHVGFLCDLEGDYSYWQKFIHRSKILEASAEPGAPPKLRDGCAFVFGGDAVDKGGGDLVRGKSRKSRVLHFIMETTELLRVFKNLHAYCQASFVLLNSLIYSFSAGCSPRPCLYQREISRPSASHTWEP